MRMADGCVCLKVHSMSSTLYKLQRLFSPHSSSGLPHRHSWHSVIGAVLSPCVLQRQCSERKVVVCPYHTQTLRTSLTPWFCGYRRHTPFTRGAPDGSRLEFPVPRPCFFQIFCGAAVLSEACNIQGFRGHRPRLEPQQRQGEAFLPQGQPVHY